MEAAFDFQMPLLVVSIAGLAGLVIYLISVFGIREKTFEEAIAAQKEISQELLGKKEQKKKTVKQRKVKGKKEEKEKQPKEKEMEKDSNSPHPHVEICSQPTIMEEHAVRRPSLLGLGGRRESIKSILINKSEVSPVGEGEVMEESNHFENRHPKDDFELKKQGSTEEDLPVEGAETEENDVEVEEDLIEVSEVPEVESQLTSAATLEVLANPNLRKGSKKSKKSQVAQSLELDATKLVAVIEKVTLSTDEIQNIIEYLLNRQVDAGNATEEWVNKSKSDTTASLKKTLAEREKQLAEEQTTVDTLQQKLKDLRLEFSGEKTRLSGMKKQLEDRNTTLQQESQQFQLRIQQLNSAIGEKQNLDRQVQELQRRTQALHDENLNLKKVLSSDQSFRMKAEGLEREAEALRTQCSHLESQLKSSFQSNSDLAAQVRGIQEHTRGLEMKVVDFEHLQGFSASLQERETQLINELKRVEAKLLETDAEKNMFREKLRDSESEIRLNREEGERKVEESHQSEKNAKNLLQDTKSSLIQAENQLKAKELELKKVQEQKDGLSEELRLLNQKLVGDGEGLEKRLAEVQETVGRLATEKEELNLKISQSVAEADTLKLQNTELHDENSKLSDSLRVTKVELEDRLNAAQSEAEKLEQFTKDAVLHSIHKRMESLTGVEVQKNSEVWLEDFVNEVKNQSKPPPAEDHSPQIQRLQGEVEQYQGALKQTESLLRNLEQSIEKAETEWGAKLHEKEEELEAVKSSISQGNTAHLEAELELQREANAKLLQRTKDLEEKLSSSQKEDNVSIASMEELKVENQELRERLRLNNHPNTEVANGNGTSPKVITASAITVDSKGGESRSGEADPLSPTGETKKKKKAASARKERKT